MLLPPSELCILAVVCLSEMIASCVLGLPAGVTAVSCMSAVDCGLDNGVMSKRVDRLGGVYCCPVVGPVKSKVGRSADLGKRDHDSSDRVFDRGKKWACLEWLLG